MIFCPCLQEYVLTEIKQGGSSELPGRFEEPTTSSSDASFIGGKLTTFVKGVHLSSNCHSIPFLHLALSNPVQGCEH